jgi:putative ABC transport system permease protein
MFFRLLLESFRRQRRRKLLAGAAILLGTTAVTAMLALATTIGDRIHRELAVYGANLIVTPLADALAVKVGGVDLKPATGNAYLHESDLQKLRGIFWANNITGISPELPVTLTVTPRPATTPGAPPFSQSHREKGGVSFASANDRTPSRLPFEVQARGLWFNHDLSGLRTGAPALHPFWKLQGRWPQSPAQVVVGKTLAVAQNLHINDVVVLPAPGAAGSAPSQEGYPYQVTGIVTAGDSADTQLLLTLESAQQLANLPDAVSRVEVSARTRPEDVFARKDPDTLSPKQRDLWYCRPYANSIAFQIHEAIPSAQAQQVRRIEQSEGSVLNRISGLMWLISAAALLAAGFAVSAAMATAILERRREIGLMRSLGASRGSIALLFYVESATLAILAGTGGYLVGSLLSAWLGARIFDAGGPGSAPVNLVLLPVVLGLALAVAIAGSTPSIRAALRLDPSTILRDDA